MATPPSVTNLQIGGMVVSLGGLDLGNVVTAEINAQDVVVLEHFTARSGAKRVDETRLIRKKLFWKFVLDEHQTDLYVKYFMATRGVGGVVNVMASALLETNISVTYKSGGTQAAPAPGSTIWTYSHTRARVRPAAAINFGDFNSFVQFDLDVDILEDAAQVGSEMGVFTFPTYP